MALPLRRTRALRTAAALGVLASTPTQAQVVTLAPSTALQCLTPAAAERGLPEYDPDLVERKIGGTVRVELTFAAPDEAPHVRHLDPPAPQLPNDLLERAVRRFVEKLRVPCIPANAEPVRLTLEYVFLPNDGRKVMASAPRDEREREQRRHSTCLTRISGPERPTYPRAALQAGQSGRLLVRLRFASPTSPPDVEFIAGPRYPSLRAEIEQFTQAYRVPCQNGEPAVLDMMFAFRFEDQEHVLIQDMPLLTFVRAAEQVPRPAYFELDRLGCPFDVRVDYYQPFKPNVVRELGSSRPDRQAFLDWMSGIALKLPKETALKVLGEKFKVTVPCGKVDL